MLMETPKPFGPGHHTRKVPLPESARITGRLDSCSPSCSSMAGFSRSGFSMEVSASSVHSGVNGLRVLKERQSDGVDSLIRSREHEETA